VLGAFGMETWACARDARSDPGWLMTGRWPSKDATNRVKLRWTLVAAGLGFGWEPDWTLAGAGLDFGWEPDGTLAGAGFAG
jgi:hypothetical protein